MLTVGGAISGYSEIGMLCCTIAPAMISSSDRTVAKIGRSMKKCENRMRCSEGGGEEAASVGGRLAGGFRLGADRHRRWPHIGGLRGGRRALDRLDLARLRLDRGAWANERVCKAADNHPVVRREAARHRA